VTTQGRRLATPERQQEEAGRWRGGAVEGPREWARGGGVEGAGDGWGRSGRPQICGKGVGSRKRQDPLEDTSVGGTGGRIPYFSGFGMGNRCG
jgi:hypothetical protein